MNDFTLTDAELIHDALIEEGVCGNCPFGGCCNA